MRLMRVLSKTLFFNEDELEELRLAAWMHDVGKITTPEYVVDKSTKLHTIFYRIYLIETRFQLIEKLLENDSLHRKNTLLQNGKNKESEIKLLDETLSDTRRTIREDLEFLKECNNPGEFMSDERLDRIKEIAKKTYYFNQKNSSQLCCGVKNEEGVSLEGETTCPLPIQNGF